MYKNITAKLIIQPVESIPVCFLGFFSVSSTFLLLLSVIYHTSADSFCPAVNLSKSTSYGVFPFSDACGRWKL